MRQTTLFEAGLKQAPRPGWFPQEPPTLEADSILFLDTETTGLRWWAGDLPVGISLTRADGRSYYLPFGHDGGNLDEARVKAWARRELRGKQILMFNAPFDINMLYAWGVDLEAQGCTVRDVGTYVALLNEYRRSYSLDSVAKEYLGVGKLKSPSPEHMAEYHAADVADYAQRDTVLLLELHEKLMPLIAQQGLRRVQDLEDSIIFPICEMVRNGAPVDEELLDQWVKSSELALNECVYKLSTEVGFPVSPTSNKDMAKLFDKCGLAPPTVPDGDRMGNVTFQKEFLENYTHPHIRMLLKARRLSSLRSKYLLKYQEEVKRNGKLRYNLHPLRCDDGGTVSGRFSSSGYNTDPPEGINVQQVPGKKMEKTNRWDEELAAYLIRKLYIPEKGKLWLKADASQIEFRLFAHYSNSKKLLSAYDENPRVDFHNRVMEMLKVAKPDIERPLTKDTNFAVLYGAGLDKTADQIGLSVAETVPFLAMYHKAFPEAKKLIKATSKVAEDRGYVFTLLGRRARFETDYDKDKSYKALNRIIQGGAADEMKVKIRELHKLRKETGFVLRFTVHDEVDGDIEDRQGAYEVHRILNRQMLDTRVPLLWETDTGANWQELTTVKDSDVWGKVELRQVLAGEEAGGKISRIRMNEK